jgi:hypothetical protein
MKIRTGRFPQFDKTLVIRLVANCADEPDTVRIQIIDYRNRKESEIELSREDFISLLKEAEIVTEKTNRPLGICEEHKMPYYENRKCDLCEAGA